VTSSSDPIACTAIDLIHPDGRRVPGRIWGGVFLVAVLDASKNRLRRRYRVWNSVEAG